MSAGGSTPGEVRPSELLDWARSHAAAMTRLLTELVEIESPSTEPEGVAALARRLGLELEPLGVVPELVPVRGTGPILRGRGGQGAARPVMLLGHLDTVWPKGTLARRPVTIDGDVFRGPGSYDMKAGLVVATFALRALAERRVLPRVVVFFTPYEEMDCEAYKPVMEAEMSACGAVLDFEPAWPGGGVKTGRKGSGSFVIRVRGRSAHAGADLDKGRNAIVELSRRILELTGFCDPATGTTLNVGTVSGGERTNVVPDLAEAGVDVRYTSLEQGRRLEQRLRGLRAEMEGVTLEVEGGLHYPPLERTPEVLGVYAKVRAIGAALGRDIEEIQTGGASEASFASALGLPTLDGLGADGDGAHAEHEHVLLSSIPERVAVSAALIAQLGRG